MNNKGFIATSLIYSFFLIFITLFLTIIADYLQNKVLLNTVEKSIKEDINNTMGIQDFEVGDILYFNTEIYSISGGPYCICEISYQDENDVNTSDKLSISSSRDCNNLFFFDFTDTCKRLKIEKNTDNTNNVINIVGCIDE